MLRPNYFCLRASSASVAPRDLFPWGKIELVLWITVYLLTSFPDTQFEACRLNYRHNTGKRWGGGWISNNRK